MSYEKFEDSSYTKLCKDLLRSKGSDDQREFLSYLRSGNEFSDWVRRQVNIDQGESLPMLEEPLTESEFKEPPKSTEKRMFDAWESISPAEACRVTFWGFVTLRHIEESRIKSSYLAANGGALKGGLERIDRTLKEGNAREFDDVVRTALRRMSGLPERGKRSVYENCPFARAWWRGYLAREICEKTGAELANVVKVLTVSQSYWVRLINLVVSKNSVLGDAKVRTALIWALSDFINDEDKKHLFHDKFLKQIERLIGIRAAWQELGVFTVEELKEIINKLIFEAVGQAHSDLIIPQ